MYTLPYEHSNKTTSILRIHINEGQTTERSTVQRNYPVGNKICYPLDSALPRIVSSVDYSHKWSGMSTVTGIGF